MAYNNGFGSDLPNDYLGAMNGNERLPLGVGVTEFAEPEIAEEEEDYTDIIEKCQKFLKRASDRWNDDIDNQERALEIAGGNFWNDDAKKRWAIVEEDNPDKELIPTIPYNNISSQVNSIASPFSRSPFHVNVVHKENNVLQDKIVSIEGSNQAKNVYQMAFTRGVTCGAGYVVVGTKLENGSVVPNLEFVSSQSMVAVDPDCITPSCEDAEEGAVISYISINKARREFGSDIVPYDYPNQQPLLDFTNIKAWKNKTDKIQLVKYFVKRNIEEPEIDPSTQQPRLDNFGMVINKKRTVVDMYTICGNKVVDGGPITLDCNIIPIVRFSGYNDYDSDYGLVYTGYVQKMYSHIEMMSLALTMQATRMRRCSNVRIVSGKSATEGCEGYFTDFEKGHSLALVWNDRQGATAPQIVNDTFQTGDIAQVLQEGRQAMQDCSGVNLAGIDTTQRTAYEVMQQQVNSESNVQELYINSEAACIAMGKIIIGILNKGIIPEFTLEGGPSVITSQMKERSEIQAVQQMVAPEHQELLAIRMAETIDSEMGKAIAQDIKANCGLQLTEGKDIGSMINACEQMKQLVEQYSQQLQQTAQENEELKKQVTELNLQLSSQKEQHKLDAISLQAQMNKDAAELKTKNAEAAAKLQNENARLQREAMIADQQQQRENAKILIDALRGNNGRQFAR